MRARSAAVLAALVALAACARAPVAIGPMPTSTPQAVDAPSASDGGTDLPAAPSSSVRADVVSVTDGDTIVLSGIDVGEVHRATGGRKARLIGVDTPEVFGVAECYGRAASAFTKAQLGHTSVRVAFDVGRTDGYGRALVYVWDARGSFFNATLVREGYALQMTVPPNVRYAALFGALAREARIAGRGLWKGC